MPALPRSVRLLAALAVLAWSACSGLALAQAGAEFNPEGRMLDSRLGVVHVGPQYPDRTREGDLLVYGAETAAALGFQTLEVFLDPRICRAANGTTVIGSLYQTGKYCDPRNPARMLARDLATLAAHPDYATVFSDPRIRRYVISFDPLNPKAANQSLISKLDRDWSKAELQLLSSEVRQLTAHLLETYEGTGKQFILSAPSEMDWHLTSVGTARGGCNRGDESCAATDADPQAVRNMIVYLNTIQDAIAAGRRDAEQTGNVSVWQACEVNFVVRADSALKTGLSEVIPRTRCDFVAWSAHEAFREIQAQSDRNAAIRRAGREDVDPTYVDRPEDLIRRGLDRISSFPPKGKLPGYKDIFIGEIGFKENHDSLDVFLSTLHGALDWGVAFVELWELFDNSCRMFNPTEAEAVGARGCKGFWLLRPGPTPNSLVASPLLAALYDQFSTPAR